MTAPFQKRDFPYAEAACGELHGHPAVLHGGDVKTEYRELTDGAGFIPLLGRTQLEVTGRDRASFLHNLCTNEVRKLAAGQGCEAFFCNVQGKTLGHALLYCGAESMVLDSVPGAAARLTEHLERYHIRESIEIVDRSDTWQTLLLAGAAMPRVLAALGVETLLDGPLGHGAAQLDGTTVQLRRVPLVGRDAWTLVCDTAAAGDVCRALQAAGATPGGEQALEQARLEAGWPWYGVDISEHNLAPEVGRDAQAISYVKGCYLGQETIARIDALGHVNRLLTGVRFSGGELPTAGLKLLRDGQEVGAVTSAAWSPRLAAPLALAYIRRGSTDAGTELSSDMGTGVVTRLPL